MTATKQSAEPGYSAGREANGDSKSEALAQDRTDMAEDRTIMAVERTFAGWMRTAFASIAIGLGFRALFGAFEPPYIAKGIATGFILLAIWIAWSAQARANASFDKMRDHAVDRPERRSLRLIAAAVSVGAAILVVGLWVLHDGSLSGL
ncbi:YidH family protein [Erythrobacter litoralis]|uniref:DUF202 domain-containing protein n=1 Tax=Erythrobacter litoralis (strain HTCC2594) TaxID=314225 RepID=Q2N5W1_ERYLH|nr:DUF202 domain-containing protein [Erythrobacter litoralis]ABC64930.1 hypothetical protein ELI_14190 [Erythrobacter litoralis HTCC2594]